MSESLRNDGRVWVPKKKGDKRDPRQIPDAERDYYLERRYPAFGNLVPRDVAARAAKHACDEGYGVGKTGLAVYLDFATAIERMGKDQVEARYGNLFEMYAKITGENPYETPMKIYPAVHYTMGGIWVDYELQTTVKGLFSIGESNFSDHGANRLGASALMQGLADGYFVLPYTIGSFLSTQIREPKIDTKHEAFAKAQQKAEGDVKRLMSINGTQSVDDFHKRLGKVMWDKCGMSRNAEGLREAKAEIEQIRQDFNKNVRIPGRADAFNPELEKAARVSDFIELGALMVQDALDREESCGGHFREEYQSAEGEAVRNDEEYKYVAAWEHTESGKDAILHKEELVFENVELKTRSYK